MLGWKRTTLVKSRTALLLVSMPALAAAAGLRVDQLRCEYRRNPLGIDSQQPRLSWTLVSARRGGRQSGYRILVSSSRKLADAVQGDLWDSGEIQSQDLTSTYGGKALVSSRQYFWRVRVWNQEGAPSEWSESATWTMGLMTHAEWKGKWIAQPGHGSLADPPPVFRRGFALAKPARRAMLHISGLGQYEAYLNGRRVGDSLIDPGWTDFRKTVLYSTYDVKSLLREGPNAIGIMLGNGFFNVPGGRYVKFTGSFGMPRVLAQLHVEFEDGSSTDLPTDSSWKASRGPITFSCVYGGEDYDARKETPGWSEPGFDDSGWEQAGVEIWPGGGLTAQEAPPIKWMRTFEPVKVTEPVAGKLVYDLGQNFAGWPHIVVEGPAGATVKLIPAETLGEDGLVSRNPGVWFAYTLKGQGTEVWQPRFSYYGFRYVQVEGAARTATAGTPRLVSLTGQFIHSSAEVAGSFECSNPLLNRIHALILAAMRSNMMSVLTDCPHREKLGWLEQSHLLGASLLFNFDLHGLYAKIARDTADAQTAGGMVPSIAPEYVRFKDGFLDSPEYGSASILVPWLVWNWYSDTRLMQQLYPTMQRYGDYLAANTRGGLLDYGLGDWCEAGSGIGCLSKDTPLGLTASATYYEDLRALEQTARLLGRPEDAARYARRAFELGRAFQARYFDERKWVYAANSQTANAMPLALGITPPGHRAAVAGSIVKDVRARRNHVSTGEIGHPYLIRALLEAGRADVLFDMIANEEAPGYGGQLRAGATTLTESWDANPALSLNHCMLGHAEEFFYRGLAGFSGFDPAFTRVTLRPHMVGGLQWVKAHYDSVRGRLVSEWRKEGADLHWKVRIPPGVEATLLIDTVAVAAVSENGASAATAPGISAARQRGCAAEFQASSGEYNFVWRDAPGCH